jgi:hypothetical protein
LPFCSGTGKQRRHKQDLGETLSGSRKVATPYDVTFLDPVPWRSLCEEYLDPSDVGFTIIYFWLFFSFSNCTLIFPLPFHFVFQLKALKDAIEDDYFFEMLVDDLPMWGYLGEVRFLFHFVNEICSLSILCRLCMRISFLGNQFRVLVCICTLIFISALASTTIR